MAKADKYLGFDNYCNFMLQAHLESAYDVERFLYAAALRFLAYKRGKTNSETQFA
jgi:hypothetical protein